MATNNHITSGLGLLTTVAQLPPKYKIRYLARAALLETPLDLTLQKPDKIIDNNYKTLNQHPITPPPSPPKKRFRDDGYQSSDSEISSLKITKILGEQLNETIKEKSSFNNNTSTTAPNEEKTPTKPIKITNSAPRTGKTNLNMSREKKTTKAIRKLKFDEETSSPVSGTIIRPLEEITNSGEEIQSGDIDPEFNIVEVTEEAKQELAQIRNIIGSYTCKLCRIEFDDAFGLARHRCSCIVLLEYRCPECGKRFNCPANLASHRRWHKPKEEVLRKQQENSENEQQYPCIECGKNFKRQAYLRKHLTTHKHKEESIKRKTTTTKLTNNYHNNQYGSNNNNSNNNITLYGNNNIIANNKYDSEYSDTRSDCSSPGRLQIIDEHNNLTEEENIAAAALAHLRNGPSVIQHTTATMDDVNSICTIGNTTTECTSYKFDPFDDETIVSEFSLVCKNEYIGPLTTTLYYIGVTIGSLLFSTLCDKVGRKKLVLICMYAIVSLSICLYFGNSLTLFILFRIAIGIFAGGLEMCTFTLIIEYSTSESRTAAAAFFEFNWTVGVMNLGGIAYKIHSWRELTLVMTIPMILSVAYSWLIPESISWLYVNNKYRECLDAIKSMAKKNQDTVTEDACIALLTNLGDDSKTITSSMENHDYKKESKSSYEIMDVLRNLILRKHLIIMVIVWFSITLSYYGIAYYLPKLSGQRHANFIIEAAAEDIGYFSSYFVLSRFGRRIPLAFYQILSGILLIFVYFIDKTEVTEWSAIALMILAKTLVASCFTGMFVFASELFPTSCRGFGLGLCSFSARTARVLESYILFLDAMIPSFIPMTSIALLVSASGVATMLLPETVNLILPNTIEEAQDIWKEN
ncbi:uncharacterized protein LOC129612972 [Condylostylus longicornis]|uniref:uncharacterized protein LOC129612972 n=1 Tax=Condylostylus longicornis TaxID=2530218 RepID=UPI00244DAEB3|nr:uncharacterized protein LOC129612972 [Condylostylus longicornis]